MRVLPTVLLVACAGRAPAHAPPAPAPGPVALPKTPAPPATFEDGPTLGDAPALRAWLDANPGRLLKVPVGVAFRADGLGVERAWIGPTGEEPPDAIRLRLDDAALGVALMDRLRRACPQRPTCAVWLEGFWGAVDTAPQAEDPTPRPFAVRRFAGLQEPGAARVFVEAR